MKKTSSDAEFLSRHSKAGKKINLQIPVTEHSILELVSAAQDYCDDIAITPEAAGTLKVYVVGVNQQEHECSIMATLIIENPGKHPAYSHITINWTNLEGGTVTFVADRQSTHYTGQPEYISISNIPAIDWLFHIGALRRTFED